MNVIHTWNDVLSVGLWCKQDSPSGGFPAIAHLALRNMRSTVAQRDRKTPRSP
ncbi:MAG: hypothetical protein HC795_05990 [Coleofasciculaceae cyanobacterium RL_1_1]|nr:hypothetical protein [Coleofasciculaceae cyanobacterium RL_1_1]